MDNKLLWESKLRTTFQVLSHKWCPGNDWPYKEDAKVISEWMEAEVNKYATDLAGDLVLSERKHIDHLKSLIEKVKKAQIGIEGKRRKLNKRLHDLELEPRAVKIKQQVEWDSVQDNRFDKDIADLFEEAQHLIGPHGERGINIVNHDYYGRYNS